MRFNFRAVILAASAMALPLSGFCSTPDLPSCDAWMPACSSNYSVSSRPSSYPINYVVIHKVQGSASSAASWFQNCSSNVSAHYTFNNSTGYCYQSVREKDIAWHVSGFNQNSIGIEHGGYITSNDTATVCYDESALETKSCVTYYGVPYDRQHIIGHSEVPGCTSGNGGGKTCHTDPGVYWNWSYYFGKCNPNTSSTTGASGVDVCTWGPGRIDVFVRGSGNDLRHQWYTSDTGWSAWESLGGTISGDPSAVSWGSGRIDVFAKGGGNSIYQKTFQSGVGWSSWANLGGSFQGSPDACSYGSGRLDVFVRGTDNAIYQKYYSAGVWSGWVNHGGTLSSDPGACASSGRIDVFARGGGDAIYRKTWISGTGWAAWSNMGGISSSGPDACSWGTGRIDLFLRGGGNAVYHRIFENNAWSPYYNIGGIATGDPGACSWGPGRLDVFVRGGGDDIYHRWSVDGVWQGGYQNLQQ